MRVFKKNGLWSTPSKFMNWMAQLDVSQASYFSLSCESESHPVMSSSLWPHVLYSPWNSPGQNTGVGSRSLLQGIFPTQGSNQGFPCCRQILYQLSHQGSPRILEWLAYPFSRGSFQPRNQIGVFCIAGGFFTSWATREAPQQSKCSPNNKLITE